MATATDRKLLTAEEYMSDPQYAGTYDELVRGEILKVTPPGFEHGYCCINLGGAIGTWARRTGLGYVAGNDSSVRTTRDPDTVRGADLCYYSRAKMPRGPAGVNLPDVPPDVVFEVVSPSDRMREVREKVNEYLAAGVGLVGVVDPRTRTVSLFRDQDLNSVVLGEAETLRDLPELPGFEFVVADIFG